MVRKSVKITVCTMAAVMAFSGMNITANAAASSSVLPSGGIELTLAKGNKLESLSTGTNSTKQIESIIETVIRDDQMDTTPEASEEESFKNLVIAQVNDYVNVRSLPSEEGEIVGKLYDDSVGLFISEENGWYQISSGSVTGYVKAEYCVTGDEAVELAKKVGTRLATVNTTTLKVRTEPSLEASVLGLVPLEDDLVVSDETDGWVQVDTEEGLGWVSTEFVSLHTEFVEAESKEEEASVLAAFLQELSHFQTVISFNGIGFDIPYLKNKCQKYGLAHPFDEKTYIDIYKEVSALKFLLKLPNYKQKTIETFLNINRDDVFSGGELIEVYENYLKTKDNQALFFLNAAQLRRCPWHDRAHCYPQLPQTFLRWFYNNLGGNEYL